MDVIEFLDKGKPRYRGNDVDISAGLYIEYFGSAMLGGNAVPGPRVIVSHRTQVSGKCKVLVKPKSYRIHKSYTGKISLGIEEV